MFYYFKIKKVEVVYKYKVSIKKYLRIVLMQVCFLSFFVFVTQSLVASVKLAPKIFSKIPIKLQKKEFQKQNSGNSTRRLSNCLQNCELLACHVMWKWYIMPNRCELISDKGIDSFKNGCSWQNMEVHSRKKAFLAPQSIGATVGFTKFLSYDLCCRVSISPVNQHFAVTSKDAVLRTQQWSFLIIDLLGENELLNIINFWDRDFFMKTYIFFGIGVENCKAEYSRLINDKKSVKNDYFNAFAQGGVGLIMQIYEKICLIAELRYSRSFSSTFEKDNIAWKFNSGGLCFSMGAVYRFHENY